MARDREVNELSRFLQSVIVGIERGIISRPIDPDPICTVDTTAVLGSWANGESTGQFYPPGLLDGNSPDFIRPVFWDRSLDRGSRRLFWQRRRGSAHRQMR